MRNMDIFTAVKDYVTAADVAGRYGITLNRNKMCSCPFHKSGREKHPSMKVDKGYKCFACGEHGDAISLAAKLTGLSQYDAAVLLIKDFGLPIETEINKEKISEVRKQYKKRAEEKKRKEEQKKLFQKIRNHNAEYIRDIVRKCDYVIAQTDNDLDCKSAVKVKESLGYWQDILWLGSDEDVKAMFKDKGIAEKCENISNIYSRLLSA